MASAGGLLEAAAHETLRRFPAERVYLYVFEQNHAARRFYASIGGREVERGIVEPPGGGSQVHWRVAWDDADASSSPRCAIEPSESGRSAP